MPGWQQTGSPDDWNSDDHSGDLWKIWSSFYHHPGPGHWRHVPCYVWNDRSSGNIQPPGKHISLFKNIYLIWSAVLFEAPHECSEVALSLEKSRT